MTDQMVRAAIQREADKAVSEFLKTYMMNNPEAAGLAARAEVRVFTKRPKGFEKEVLGVLDGLINISQYRRWTNAQIIAGIQDRYEGYAVPKGWMDRKIPSYLIDKVGVELRAAGHLIDLRTHDTLSKIKRALRGEDVKARSVSKVTVTVAFSDKTVVVDDRSYTVVTDGKGYQRIKVGEQKLRCDVLKTLLAPNKQPLLIRSMYEKVDKSCLG